MALVVVGYEKHMSSVHEQGEGASGVKAYVEEKGLAQISDPAQIGKMLDSIIEAHPKELESFRSGKTKIQGYFSGYALLHSFSLDQLLQKMLTYFIGLPECQRCILHDTPKLLSYSAGFH